MNVSTLLELIIVNVVMDIPWMTTRKIAEVILLNDLKHLYIQMGITSSCSLGIFISASCCIIFSEMPTRWSLS